MAATAGIIIIGDEILKGLVRDSNSYYFCEQLWQLGVKVNKISTISDDIDAIAKEVRTFSSSYDFVLTSGGIGPTHDDVTIEGIAAAFGEELVHSNELEDLWPKEGPQHRSEYVTKMMKLPQSARLEFGTDRSCPLAVVRNVHVYPGVPQYLKRTFESNKCLYRCTSMRFYRMMAFLNADELDMAGVLGQAQKKFNGFVSLGSYPVLDNSSFSLKVTGESTCKDKVDEMCSYLRAHIDKDKVVQIRMSRSHNLSSTSSVEEAGTTSSSEQLKWLLGDNLSTFSDTLFGKIVCSTEVVEECMAQYRPEEICLAYNGGKDCTVLLHMLYAMWIRNGRKEKIKILYISPLNPFKEADTFIQESIERYNLHMIKITGQIREALEELKERDGQIKAILLGTRYSDPYSDKLTTFCPTDTQWPDYMRVHPILEWTYTDIWSYIKALSIPYCSLYDQGYTSLGSTINTVPNPELKRKVDTSHAPSEETESYLPAYMLTDDTMERAGRN